MPSELLVRDEGLLEIPQSPAGTTTTYQTHTIERRSSVQVSTTPAASQTNRELLSATVPIGTTTHQTEVAGLNEQFVQLQNEMALMSARIAGMSNTSNNAPMTSSIPTAAPSQQLTPRSPPVKLNNQAQVAPIYVNGVSHQQIGAAVGGQAVNTTNLPEGNLSTQQNAIQSNAQTTSQTYNYSGVMSGNSTSATNNVSFNGEVRGYSNTPMNNAHSGQQQQMYNYTAVNTANPPNPFIGQQIAMSNAGTTFDQMGIATPGGSFVPSAMRSVTSSTIGGQNAKYSSPSHAGQQSIRSTTGYHQTSFSGTPSGYGVNTYRNVNLAQQSTGPYITSTMEKSSSCVENTRIIGERIVEHEVKVPKKVTREDIIEKVIVVPEKVVHEEIVEDVQRIREKIIEVAVPTIQERIVEVPEIEYVEKIVEVPEVIYQEKVRHVPKIQIVERVTEVPQYVTKERIVEVPEIEYRDVPVDKIVEVPEIREQIVIKEVPVTQYVEKPVPEFVDVEEERDVLRTVPVPVEAITVCEFRLPKLRPRYQQVDVPLYVPRFMEVPVPLDVMETQSALQAERYARQVTSLIAQPAISLCEIENLAHNIRTAKFEELFSHTRTEDQAALIAEHWNSGRLTVDPASMTYSATAEKNSLKIDTTSTTIHYGEPCPTPIEALNLAASHQLTTTINSTKYATPLTQSTHHKQHSQLDRATANNVSQMEAGIVGNSGGLIPSSFGMNTTTASRCVDGDESARKEWMITKTTADYPVVAAPSPRSEALLAKMQMLTPEELALPVCGGYTHNGVPVVSGYTCRSSSSSSSSSSSDEHDDMENPTA